MAQNPPGIIRVILRGFSYGFVHFGATQNIDQSIILAKKVRTLRMNLFLGMTKNEIKVAAIGLKRCHLGQRLANVRNHLEKLKNQFGVHPAGEGACSRTSTFTSF